MFRGYADEIHRERGNDPPYTAVPASIWSGRSYRTSVLSPPARDIGGDNAGVRENRVVGARALALVDRIAQFARHLRPFYTGANSELDICSGMRCEVLSTNGDMFV